MVSGSVPGLTGTPGVISADPLLDPLQDNGGPTPTMALLPGSPAIGAGVSLGGITTDQRGVLGPRPRASGPTKGPR
jgi:hypothetical protein